MVAQPNQSDWFLHAHTAAALDERLNILKQPPQNILLAAADGNESYRLLKMRYPKAHFHEFDSRTTYLQQAQSIRTDKQSWWQKFRNNLPLQTPTDQLPTTATANMVWSNLGLIHQVNPTTIIKNWASALQTNGLLFFSHFGPDTLKEIRALWQKNGIKMNTACLLDMHDLGDMLLQHGFYDPVTDMSMLTLQYTTVERFIADMKTAGLWRALQIENETDAIHILTEAWQKKQTHNITLELVYGHGVKKQILPENTATIQIYPKRSPTKY